MEITATEQYLNSIKEEFFTKINRVKQFVKHAPSIGFGNEEVLRNFLKTHLPERFAVGTGFVYLNNNAVSRQCDLLIYDQVNYAPFFKEGDFVIVHPEAVAAVIEMKTTLTKKEAHDSIDKIKSVKEVVEKAREQNIKCYIFGVSFSFTTQLKLTTVKNWLQSYPNPLNKDMCPEIIIVLGKMFFFRPSYVTNPDFMFTKMDIKDDFSFPMFFGLLMNFLNTKTLQIKRDPVEDIQRYANIFDNPQRTWYRFPIQIGVPAKPYELDILANKDFFQKDPHKALKHIESAIQKGRSTLGIFRDKALLLFRMERFTEYLKYFSEIYSKFESAEGKQFQKELLTWKSLIELNLRCWDDALKTLELLISQYPDDFEIKIGKSYCLVGLSNYDEAIQICDTELSKQANNSILLRNKGLALKKKGDAVYTEVLGQVINGNGELYDKAAAYALLGDKKRMLKFLKKAIAAGHIWKVAAKYDIEFDAFREDKDFQKVLDG